MTWLFAKYEICLFTTMSEVTNRKSGRSRNKNSNETELVERGKSKLESVGGDTNEMRPSAGKKKNNQSTNKAKQETHEDSDEDSFIQEEEEIISGDEEGEDVVKDPYKMLLREKLHQENGFWTECCADCFWQFMSVFCIFSGAGVAICFEPLYKLTLELYYMIFD